MAQIFAQIWRLYSIRVPAYGFNMTAGQLFLGIIAVLFSIFVLKHILWR